MKNKTSNKEILDKQLDDSNELVEFQKKYVPSKEEQLEINDMIGDMDIFNIRATLASDKSNYVPIELIKGKNSLINARNKVIEETNKLIEEYPNANIVQVDTEKFVMFRDMIEETINNIDEEACETILANIEEIREHEAVLKREQEKFQYFTIKFTKYNKTFIIFEYMPLPPSQMLEHKIPLPKFRFITLGTLEDERPDIQQEVVDEYVAKFYYEFEKLHTIDETKVECNVFGGGVEDGE